MTAPVILIGPMCAGKSTVAALLAEKLGLPRVEVDEHRWDYYDAMGRDKAKEAALIEAGDQIALLEYFKPYEVYTVERVLQDHAGSVIDFGAGHTVHEDAALFARVQAAFAPHPNVILVLPAPDLDESVRVLNARMAALLEREVGAVDPAILDLNAHYVRHPSNQRLARITVYTDGQTPEQTCAAILGQLAG